MIDERFIKEWLSHHEANVDNMDAALHWTDEKLIDLSLAADGDEELWDFVLKTYKCNLSDGVLAVLAAGPLEDLLASNGEAYIDQVETLALKDPRFKKLLGGVWKNAMSEKLWARVCAVKGEPW